MSGFNQELLKAFAINFRKHWPFFFMDKLGFTWYPQDWWSSDTFFDFDSFERYVYLECLFIMYRNDGYMKTQKTQFENRIRISVSDEVWQKVTSKFMKMEEGFTSLTVNKRLKKAFTSRENGSLGGRPPKVETQKTHDQNLKRKRNIKEKRISAHGQEGKYSFTIAAKYAGDKIQKVHDLRTYFTHTNQIDNLIQAGWKWFDEFLKANAGKMFNEDDHVYNSFREFCIKYKPPETKKEFADAEYNKSLWTSEAWEKQYAVDLKNNSFRKHFGYAEL